jgi:5-methylcytosine-specific restriction protein A
MESSYIITWKPATENTELGWDESNLTRLFESFQANGYAEEEWRFKRRTDVQLGERVFLVRQGRKGHALLGTGIILSLTSHPERTARIRFDRLVDTRSKEVLATAAELKAIPEGQKWWGTQSSGVLLPVGVAQSLAKLAERTPVTDARTGNPDWTRDELILALELYFRVPLARGNKTHPECLKLSDFLNKLPIHSGALKSSTFRNANGVGMKLSNFLRFDPAYSGKGLPSGSLGEKEVWDSFAHDLTKLQAAAAAIRSGADVLLESGGAASQEDDGAEEGRVLTRLHKLRERSPTLARKKKEAVLAKQGALRCEVCEFDFHATYGKLGEGFAECHHKVPISSYEITTKTTLADLHVVCSNCHRMLHKGERWPSVEELRSSLKTQLGKS